MPGRWTIVVTAACVLSTAAVIGAAVSGAAVSGAAVSGAADSATAASAWVGPRLCATRPAPSNVPGSKPITSGPSVWSFRSAPRLHPMRVSVLAHRRGTAAGQIFVAPYSTGRMVGQTGALILDSAGNPVWFRPLPSPRLQNADFKVQSYRNPWTGATQPVLTFWQGTIAIPPAYTNLPAGSPEPGGCYYIYDRHYRLVRTISARHGFTADEHEFLLTRRYALFIGSRTVRMDLRRYGGPKHGAIEDNEAQEISLATGRLVFSWDIMRHVSPALSEVAASSAGSSGGVWDAYHMNSLDPGPGGQLLISSRNMWAVYDISMRTGRILWQLGGRRSDFTFGHNADFFWQHDARFRRGSKISMFDDGCCDLPDGLPEQQSHGLVLHLNFRRHHASAVRTFYHDPGLYSPSQGNMQLLRNGNEFIGWGQNAYYSEYAPLGNSLGYGAVNLLYDAKMPGSNISYRTFRQAWVGLPCYPPSLAVKAGRRHVLVYASWNGSTQTAAWQVLAGLHPYSLAGAGYSRRTGFQTTIKTRNPGPYYQVLALSATGKVLRASRVVRRHW